MTGRGDAGWGSGAAARGSDETGGAGAGVFAGSFLFIRHGVTDHNRARLVMGQRDVPLNDDGRRQARRAAALLVGRGVRSIVASPLLRARETAEIIAAVIAAPIRTMPGLMERHWGIFEGRDRSERPLQADPEGGETLTEFSRRTLAALTAVADPATVLVVAHNGTARVLRRHLGLPGAEDIVPNATPLHFQSTAQGWREQTLSTALVPGAAACRAGVDR